LPCINIIAVTDDLIMHILCRLSVSPDITRIREAYTEDESVGDGYDQDGSAEGLVYILYVNI
jgi:hypothetical protein